MKSVDKDRALLFRDRAEHFLLGLNELADLHPDDSRVLSSMGLLAVHCAISFVDAILVHNIGKRSDGDHKDAGEELRALAKGLRIKDLSGVQHFKGLLGRKNAFAYDARYLTMDDAKNALEQARSVAAWTYANFKGLARTEETTDAVDE